MKTYQEWLLEQAERHGHYSKLNPLALKGISRQSLQTDQKFIDIVNQNKYKITFYKDSTVVAAWWHQDGYPMMQLSDGSEMMIDSDHYYSAIKIGNKMAHKVLAAS